MTDMQRLDAIRLKNRQNEAERNRLSGVLEGAKEQLAKIEADSMAKFGVPVSELALLAATIEKEKEEILSSIEATLGLVAK